MVCRDSTKPTKSLTFRKKARFRASYTYFKKNVQKINTLLK